MERPSPSISTLTESCLCKFNNLLTSYGQRTQYRPSLEGRLSDFNHWAISVGAVPTSGISLDSRLQGRAKDFEVVKDFLLVLAECLDDYTSSVKVKTSDGETDYERAAIHKLDCAINKLVLMGDAILWPEQESWKREADRTVDGGDTKLHDAIRKRETDLVDYLLSHGANVEAQDVGGDTPLHRAAQTGQTEVAELLLSQGANIEAGDKYGNTPLHCAVAEKHGDTIGLLLSRGADVNAKNKTQGNTPLHLAAINGSVGIGMLLLDRGADINAINNQYETPLHLAVRAEQLEMAKFLVD